jgi:hypothetical protein
MYDPRVVAWILIDRHEVPRMPSVGTVQIPLRYRVSFSTALVPKMQLWHLLVSVQSVGDLHSHLPEVLHSHYQADSPPVVETRQRLDDVDQDNAECIAVQQYQLDHYRHKGLRACRSIRRVYSMVTWPQLSPAVHCVSWVRLTTRSVCRRDNSAEKRVTPLDGDVYVDMLYIFDLFFKKELRIMQSLYANFV